MNFTDVIPDIVSGFELRKGSLVLLNFWGENRYLNILDKFAIEVAKAGGVPVRWQQSREFFKNYFAEVPEENLDFPDKYFDIFKAADAIIDIFMYGPAPHKGFSKDKLSYYGAYMKKLFGAVSDSKELFIQVRVPTEENAADEGIPYEIYKDAMHKALSVDYKKLKQECSVLVEKLKDKNMVRICTGNKSELTFNISNRHWYKDDGTGDIPCGEVFTAPIEESAEGKILIPEIFLEGERLSDVILNFKSGRLTECSSDKLMEFIKRFHGDNDVIAEFGIGLNENVRKLTGCTLIDEKCRGTAHIAVGMNNLFGGKNSSELHMDFIFRPVKIEIDHELFMDGSEIL